ncbi:hypothetical protein C2S51_038723 [Perilla frutescens var. frutescens]|nr:hypothetical protein C2S51_038723 [Perilla frutescens var. frutescens]
MSYSRILLQGQGLPLKSNAGTRTRTMKVVCCCPWPGSDTNSKDNLQSIISRKQRRLPPGPSPLHLIALSHYFIRSLPLHHALTDLAKTYGPLMHFNLGELPLIVVSSPKIAKELLKTHDTACAYRPKTMVSQVISYDYSDVVTSPYGDYWKQLRNICIVELLSAKNIRSFEYIRKDEGSILVDCITSASPAPFNLTERIFWFMNSTTCRAVFGNVSMDRAHTISLIRGAMAAAGNLELADLFPSFKLLLNRFTWKAHELVQMKPEMDKILDDIIDRHRENLAVTGKGYGELGTEDFVDVLIRLKEETQFSMTDDTIKALICDMFAGGTESASSAVDWTMVELVRNPRVMAKVQSEIRQAFGGRKTIEESEIRNLKYLKVVVKESMRLHPPNALIPRSCGEEMEIDGYHIPQNSAIVVNAWLLGRDPSHWREPERFEPERFEGNPIDFLGNNFEFIPFGSGKRICPGMAFAVANVEFVLAQLLYFFDWKLPPGVRPADLDMTEADGFAASRKCALNLIATPFALAS